MFIIARKQITPRRMLNRARIVLESCSYRNCNRLISDNSISSYRLHASETQQLSYVPMFVADATSIFCRLYGVARMQPSANDGPTCSTPWQHNGSEIDSLHGKTFWDRCNYLLHRCIGLSAAIGVLNVGNHRHS